MKREEIEELVREPLNPGRAAVAARVYSDSALWPAFEKALYPDAEPTDAEREAIDRVVAERCAGASARRREALRDFVAARLERISGGMKDFALAAASDVVRSGASAKSGDDADPVTFVFVSEPAAGARSSWRAEMTLPPNAAVDDMLPIAIADGDGQPLDGGTFKVAGVVLPISRGRAEIPYGMFLSGLKDATVERIDAQGLSTHGTLALF